MSKYILRYGAGAYWLVDTSQAGVPYKPPVCINELAARVFELASGGMEPGEIIDSIAAEYEEDSCVVGPDVEEFYQILITKGFLE